MSLPFYLYIGFVTQNAIELRVSDDFRLRSPVLRDAMTLNTWVVRVMKCASMFDSHLAGSHIWTEMHSRFNILYDVMETLGYAKRTFQNYIFEAKVSPTIVVMERNRKEIIEFPDLERHRAMI